MKVPFHDNPVQNGRTNEWRKEAMEFFGVFIYSRAHTKQITFLLFHCFYEFSPGGLRIPQKKKIRGLGA